MKIDIVGQGMDDYIDNDDDKQMQKEIEEGQQRRKQSEW